MLHFRWRKRQESNLQARRRLVSNQLHYHYATFPYSTLLISYQTYYTTKRFKSQEKKANAQAGKRLGRLPRGECAASRDEAVVLLTAHSL